MRVTKWEIKLNTGDVFELSSDEKERLMKVMNTRGTHHARWQTDDQTVIFISKITYIKPIEFEETKLVVNIEDNGTDTTTDVHVVSQEDLLERLKELSSCTHENESLYYKETKTGIKYFMVCDFCGRRSRFMKADDISDDEKSNAIEWIDKE